MNKLYLAGASLATGVLMTVFMSASVLAWHPKGQIEKSVLNQTANSELKDFVEAEPGDILKYVIVISNKGKYHSKGWNDMHFTVLKDALPTGVELVSDPAKRQITENLGVIKAGEQVKREYLVRVTSDKDSDLIVNEACFTGNSEVKDAPQKGCDKAKTKVNVPPAPEPEPEPEPKPEPKGKGEVKPVVLPETGAGSLIGAFAGISGLGYALHRVSIRKRR